MSKQSVAIALSILLSCGSLPVAANEDSNNPSNAAFTIPDFYGQTPVDRVQSEIVKEWPRFTFLESVLTLPDSMLVTDHKQGIIYRLQSGKWTNLIDIDGEMLCLSAIAGDEQHFMATAWVKNEDKTEGVLLKVNQDGDYETVANFPTEAFLNGITQLQDGRFLLAGSASGNIWFYDPATNKQGVWYHGELTEGQYGFPGINGIKVLDDVVYFSNTAKFIMGKIEIKADGSAGKAALYTRDTLIDDFAIDQDGTIYGATHKDEIIKITPDGNKTIIAQYDQGVTGSTSVNWDHTQPARKSLLVATNGGINHKLFGKGESSVTPAKVVRLYLD